MTIEEMNKTITGLYNNEPEKTIGQLTIMSKADLLAELEKAKSAKSKRKEDAEAIKNTITDFSKQLDAILEIGFAIERSDLYIEKITNVLCKK